MLARFPQPGGFEGFGAVRVIPLPDHQAAPQSESGGFGLVRGPRRVDYDQNSSQAYRSWMCSQPSVMRPSLS